MLDRCCLTLIDPVYFISSLFISQSFTLNENVPAKHFKICYNLRIRQLMQFFLHLLFRTTLYFYTSAFISLKKNNVAQNEKIARYMGFLVYKS